VSLRILGCIKSELNARLLVFKNLLREWLKELGFIKRYYPKAVN